MKQLRKLHTIIDNYIEGYIVVSIVMQFIYHETLPLVLELALWYTVMKIVARCLR